MREPVANEPEAYSQSTICHNKETTESLVGLWPPKTAILVNFSVVKYLPGPDVRFIIYHLPYGDCSSKRRGQKDSNVLYVHISVGCSYMQGLCFSVKTSTLYLSDMQMNVLLYIGSDRLQTFSRALSNK